MEVTEIFYPKKRPEWRDWLQQYHHEKEVIWLQRFRKATGIPCITYDELVEECLCFGWILECGERRREEAQKRLNYLIKNTKKGKMYGTRPLEGINL